MQHKAVKNVQVYDDYKCTIYSVEDTGVTINELVGEQCSINTRGSSSFIDSIFPKYIIKELCPMMAVSRDNDRNQ